MCQKGKIFTVCLPCSFHAAWRGRHPVRGDCFVCLVFLTFGKLNPIPKEQDDQCRLPYQLGQGAGGTTPQPSSSPCPQCLELLPERHLLSFFPTQVFLLPRLGRGKRKLSILGGTCCPCSSVAVSQGTGRDASMGDEVSPSCCHLAVPH